MPKRSESVASAETLVPIRAAGGVVLRTGPEGPLVLAVHRQRYDDWSLPKGKNDPDEQPGETARREVTEETGQQVRLIAPLGRTEFDTGAGQKEVDWFAMRPTRITDFVPNDEVDELRWVPIDRAGDLLTYEADRRLVGGIDAAALLSTGTVFLVRHGAAGDRQVWDGDDRARPLSNKGRRQAKGIAALLAGRDIEVIVSSPYVRCHETVAPLADEFGLKITDDESLAEGSGGKASRELVRGLLGANAVLCSHGDVIPALIDWMTRKGMALRSPFDCKKGSVWEIEVTAGQFSKARYLPPPET